MQARRLLLVVLALATVAGCSSGAGHGKSSPAATASKDADSCVALVGRPMSAKDRCVEPIKGLTTPAAFPCYAQSGTDFYYFTLQDRYIYGLEGGTWRQDSIPANGSLGPIANDLGC